MSGAKLVRAFLNFGFALICSPTFGQESPTTDISQIVIVYSPANDGNGFFRGIGVQLGPVLKAAQEKNLKVVLVNTDDTDIGDVTQFKAKIGPLLQREKSWLILATHGHRASGKGYETTLDFPGGIVTGDLKDMFATAEGVYVHACNGFGDTLMSSAKIGIASSQMNKTAYNESAIITSTALARLIEAGPTPYPGLFLYRELEAEIHRQSATSTPQYSVDPLTSNDGEKATFPVSGGLSPQKVQFKGGGFELLDLGGRVAKRCKLGQLKSAEISDYKTKAFLSDEILPGIEARNLLGAGGARPDPSRPLDNEYLRIMGGDSVQRTSHQASVPVLRCNGLTGNWRLTSPKNCLGRLVASAECEKGLDPANKTDPVKKNLWSQGCAQIATQRQKLLGAGIEVESDQLCITGCLPVDSLDRGLLKDATRSSIKSQLIAPGSCLNGKDGVSCPVNTSLFPLWVEAVRKSNAMNRVCCDTSSLSRYLWDDEAKLCRLKLGSERSESPSGRGH